MFSHGMPPLVEAKGTLVRPSPQPTSPAGFINERSVNGRCVLAVACKTMWSMGNGLPREAVRGNITCQHCGAIDTDDAWFCWRCGVKSAAKETPAGLWARAAAYCIDVAVCSVPAFVALALIGIATYRPPHLLEPDRGPRVPGWLTALLLALWAIGFLVYFAAFNRRTLGAMALGIELRDARTGEPVSHRRALGRFVARLLLYAALIAPGVVCDLFVLWTRRKQNLIDLLFRTVVVRP